MLEIIKNEDRIYKAYNLYDPDKDRLVLTQWADSVSRITLGKAGYTYYLVTNFEDFSQRRSWLLDERGKEVFEGKYSSISTWCKGEYENQDTILAVTRVDDDLTYLVTLQEDILTEGYTGIGRYEEVNGHFLRVYKKENAKGAGPNKVSFVTYPGFKRITQDWFDSVYYDDDRCAPFREEPDFVAVVKNRGRYKAVFADGSLQDAPLIKD